MKKLVLSRQTDERGLAGIVFVLATLIFCALSLLPGTLSQAYADYKMPEVEIQARVEEDGSLSVHEERVFKVDESVNGVFWSIPSTQGKTVRVESAGLRDGEGLAPFTQSSEGRARKGDRGLYTVSNASSNTELKLYYPIKSDRKARFYIDYKVLGAVDVHADVAELYWKFVGPDWKASSQDVHLQLSFAGNSNQNLVPGENIHAYGHGTLNGEINFERSDLIDYRIDTVRPGSFAEARVLFPLDMVAQVTPSSDKAYDSILQEEADWAKQTNAMREKLRQGYQFRAIASVIAALVVLLVVFIMWLRYGKDYRSSFRDKYFRDVPNNMHPAVLAHIWRGSTQMNDLTASIMRLANLGALNFERIQNVKPGLLWNSEEDDLLIQKLWVDKDQAFIEKQLENPVDRMTYYLLFNALAPKRQQILVSEIPQLTRANSETYSQYETMWRSRIKDRIREQNDGSPVLETTGRIFQVIAFILGGFCLMNIMFYLSQMDYLPSHPLLFVGLALVVTSAILVFILAIFMNRCTKSAQEIKDKMDALKNWFEDFTLLKEAPTTHVKVWKELIVLAVVLGVADKVIKQLKLLAPEVLESPEFRPMYPLFHGPNFYGVNNLNSTMVEAQNVLAQEMAKELASSFNSSTMGSGGGFSIGGGGGFGGGGGGTF